MKTILVIGLCALALAGCKAPETASRFDGSPAALSVTHPLPAAVDLQQSLAAISMKDALPAGAPLRISEKARAMLSAYAQY